MRYLSVCSGIEAATVAWHPLGWEAAAFSEIEKFPRQVLAHHYPKVPCHGDFTTIKENQYGTIDLLVGGTPCQAFSVAGLRKGLSDARGNLTLEFLRLVTREQPRIVVWENVPGVLSIDGGRTFGAFLAGLAKCGYGFAYRVLDAQYFGVPQRRRRVFVIGYFGDWRPAAAILFERESMYGDITPRRQARQSIAALTATGVGTCGADDNQGQAWHLIAHTLRAEYDASEDGTGRGIPLVSGTIEAGTHPGSYCGQDAYNDKLIPVEIPILEAGGRVNNSIPINTQLGLRGPDTSNSIREGIGIGNAGDPMFTLQAAHQHAVAFDLRGREGGAMPEGAHDTANIRASSGGSSRSYIAEPMAVRRLTPRECERLQGFPDDYTLITSKTADGPRYKALGNSMAVPVMRWLGERIKLIENL